MPFDSIPSLQELLPPGFVVKEHDKLDSRLVTVKAPAGMLPNGKDGAFDQLLKSKISPRRVYVETSNTNNEYILKLASDFVPA